jgi:hypothetical protein
MVGKSAVSVGGRGNIDMQRMVEEHWINTGYKGAPDEKLVLSVVRI